MGTIEHRYLLGLWSLHTYTAGIQRRRIVHIIFQDQQLWSSLQQHGLEIEDTAYREKKSFEADITIKDMNVHGNYR